jgi:outer membrane protein TolC
MHKKIATYFFFLFCFLSAGAQERSLDYFITQGLSGSPLLKDYQNQILTNVQDSLLIKAGQKPKIDAIGQILIPLYGKNFGYDEAITNGGNYSAIVGVSQNLFMNNVLNNEYKNLNLQNQLTSADTKISELELKKLITGQYLTAFSQYAEMLFAKEVLELLKEEQKILKLLTENGIYKQSDYYAFLIEEQTQEGSVLQQQIVYRQELYNLDFLCGISDTSLYTLSDAQIVQSDVTNVESTPVYGKFLIDSLISINSQKKITLKYKPTLEWFADMGVNSIDPLLAYKFFGFSFGLNFTMPIYDGKQKNIEIKKMLIAEDSRKNYEDFYKKQYSLKSIQLKQKIASYDILAAQIEKKLISINTLIEMNKLQLNTGELSVTDHILTINNYIEAKHQLIVLKLEKSQMINELNYIGF